LASARKKTQAPQNGLDLTSTDQGGNTPSTQVRRSTQDAQSPQGEPVGKPQEKPDSPIRKARDVSCRDRVILYARAAGRCSFRGCPRNIVEHHLTGDAGNFGETAHIYAFSEDGPRGDAAGRPANPDVLENLILLCPPCHKLVDDNPHKYPVEELRAARHMHEQRIRRVADLLPEHRALALLLVAPIAGQPSAIADEHVAEAVRPRYLVADPFVIAHSLGRDEAPEAIQQAARHVSDDVAAFLATHRRHGNPPVGVFAIAPIPLLIHLGYLLGNKRWVELYQLHRDTCDWTWKVDGEPVDFATNKLREGRSGKVAIIVSISGRNGVERLPLAYHDATVYELAPIARDPVRTLVRRREDLANFRRAYRDALDAIRRDHGNPAELGMFPAVPIPFALVLGADLLPKADPMLDVHDLRKDKLIPIMKVNHA
jgi:hypothetical protein